VQVRDNKEKIIRLAKLELARREFFYYCQLKTDGFYKKSRKYLVKLCNELEDFIKNDEYNVLILNLPP
jgi:hypothetical protein